jgi:two-component system KDP operon response regulator KdpE
VTAAPTPAPTPLVLVVEDEAPMQVFLRATLTAHGYRVAEAMSGEQGLAWAASRPPDVVLLDLGLPDCEGFDVIRRLRAFCAAPILVLSARGGEHDKVQALDAGADDYLTKPFGVGELLARIRVALRHRSRLEAGDHEQTFTAGDLQVDLVHRRVSRSGCPVQLTPIEYRLLVALVRHAGKVLTHRFILREVWGPNHSDDARYVRVFVASLRRKIETDASRPRYLLTEQGVGYRLVDG